MDIFPIHILVTAITAKVWVVIHRKMALVDGFMIFMQRFREMLLLQPHSLIYQDNPPKFASWFYVL